MDAFWGETQCNSKETDREFGMNTKWSFKFYQMPQQFKCVDANLAPYSALMTENGFISLSNSCSYFFDHIFEFELRVWQFVSKNCFVKKNC